MGSTRKTGTRSTGSSTRRPGVRSRKPGVRASTTRSGGTRTSSRSAKRRSPKAPPPDPGVMEVERLEFLRAMDRYKRKTGKTFPSWTEVLAVLRSIGWMSPLRMRSKTGQPN